MNKISRTESIRQRIARWIRLIILALIFGFLIGYGKNVSTGLEQIGFITAGVLGGIWLVYRVVEF